MKLFGREQRPGDPVERTPQELFAEADAQREDLHARLDVARAQCDDLRARVAKDRDGYQAELAEANIAGAPSPSCEALRRLEGELAVAVDLVVGLERRVTAFEPQWLEAKRGVLYAEVTALRDSAAAVQQQIHEGLAEQRAVENRVGTLHYELRRMLDQVANLERQAHELGA